MSDQPQNQNNSNLENTQNPQSQQAPISEANHPESPKEQQQPVTEKSEAVQESSHSQTEGLTSWSEIANHSQVQNVNSEKPEIQQPEFEQTAVKLEETLKQSDEVNQSTNNINANPETTEPAKDLEKPVDATESQTTVETTASKEETSATILPPNSNSNPNATPPVNSQKSNSNLGAVFAMVVVGIVISVILSGLTALLISQNNKPTTEVNRITKEEITSTRVTDENSAIIEVSEKSRPSVVSVVITRELPNIEKKLPFNFPDRSSSSSSSRSVEVGAGTGFIVSENGMIVTNRHVVRDTSADYTVVFEDGTKLTAKVLGRDPILDIAILKVETDKKLVPLPLGDSDKIKVGQTAIAIGNSLGEFSNTVSKGIVSGLGRTIVASDESGNSAETLQDIIQTDASINPGNSGGPLLDINGNVIGVNVARSQGGENIGFSININSVKPILDSVMKTGKIQRPYIGVQYTMVTPEVVKDYNLKVDYGAFVKTRDESGASVRRSGPADKAGIKDGDVLLALNGEKLTTENNLRSAIQKYRVGETVTFQVQRGENVLEIKVTLENFPDLER